MHFGEERGILTSKSEKKERMPSTTRLRSGKERRGRTKRLADDGRWRRARTYIREGRGRLGRGRVPWRQMILIPSPPSLAQTMHLLGSQWAARRLPPICHDQSLATTLAVITTPPPLPVPRQKYRDSSSSIHSSPVHQTALHQSSLHTHHHPSCPPAAAHPTIPVRPRPLLAHPPPTAHVSLPGTPSHMIMIVMQRLLQNFPP